MFENLIVKYTYSNFICLKIEINKLIRLNLLKFGSPGLAHCCLIYYILWLHLLVKFCDRDV